MTLKKNSESKEEDHTNKFVGIRKDYMKYKTWLGLKILIYIPYLLGLLLVSFLFIVGIIDEVKNGNIATLLISVGTVILILSLLWLFAIYLIKENKINKSGYNENSELSSLEIICSTIVFFIILELIVSIILYGGIYQGGKFMDVVGVLK